jgi:hypothetical protein
MGRLNLADSEGGRNCVKKCCVPKVISNNSACGTEMHKHSIAYVHTRMVGRGKLQRHAPLGVKGGAVRAERQKDAGAKNLVVSDIDLGVFSQLISRKSKE